MRVRKEGFFTGTRDPHISEREKQHRMIARRAASDGMVLLENKNQILPLKKGEKVALYGAGASRTIKGGTGSGDVNERDVVSIYQGMKQAGFVVTNEDWIMEYDAEYDKARLTWRDSILSRMEGDGLGAFFDVYSETPFEVPCGGMIQKTEADIAFYIISRVAGEAKDRYHRPGDYLLTAEEKRQLTDVCSLYSHVVVVVNTGGLVDLSFMDEFDNIDALLYIVQPGMEGGNAFADVILGNVTPSGKLTDSWAYHYEDFPNSDTFSHNNGNVEKEYYKEGIYVGYRYFDTFEVPVRYGFGYGMSYTEFDIRFVSVLWNKEKNVFTISANVMNAGEKYCGKEVVQVYVTCPDGKLEKEYRRLAAFAKTKLLAPGECQDITMEVSADYLTSYSETAPGWLMEKGTYVFWLGNSLAQSVPVSAVVLNQDVLVTKTKNIAKLQESMDVLTQDGTALLKRREELELKCLETGVLKLEVSSDDIRTEEIVYRENAEYVSQEAAAFVETLTLDKLVALASGDPGKAQGGNLGAAGMTVPGSAGETNNCALDDNLASIVLADGPAGLRLNKYYHVHNGKIIQKPFEFSIEGGLFYVSDEADLGDRYYQYCTAIPVGILLAQTWDVDLIREVGQMVGREMQEFNITLWLAPGMNIHRNPLCGRNFEYYSEDPVVAGKIAAAMTGGVQSVPGCGTTIKHLTCNNQEDNRMNSDSIMPERVLREIYLRGFEIAVKESQPMSIMTSYNMLNGIHVANSYDICTEVVRAEWGFQGMIMTDWTTTEKGPWCTASGCMRAGNDLVMPGALCDRDNLYKELEDGTLSMKDLKACISRLVNIIWQSNQYEDAVPYDKLNKSSCS